MQYTHGEEDSEINQQGVEQIARLKMSYAQLYWDFVRDFAEGIKNAIEQIDLPSLPLVPALAEIPSAFGVVRPVPARAGPTSAQPGFRRQVRFIFAALDPSQLGGGRDPAPYQDRGGPDSKPFTPTCSGASVLWPPISSPTPTWTSPPT